MSRYPSNALSWRRFEAALGEIPEAVEREARAALLKGGQELQEGMELLAPEDTGDLKNSIHVTGPNSQTPPYSQPGGSRTTGPLEIAVTAGNSEVRYTHLVEYGTKHSAEQPFFWPVVRSLRKRVMGRINRAIKKGVREEWGR